MILYHVTVKIDKDAEKDWLQWMTSAHIPEVMNTRYFEQYRITRMIADEADGTTYSIQYIAKDMASIENYLEHEAPRLQEDHTKRYEGKFVAYRTFHHILEDTQA